MLNFAEALVYFQWMYTMIFEAFCHHLHLSDENPDNKMLGKLPKCKASVAELRRNSEVLESNFSFFFLLLS